MAKPTGSGSRVIAASGAPILSRTHAGLAPVARWLWSSAAVSSFGPCEATIFPAASRLLAAVRLTLSSKLSFAGGAQRFARPRLWRGSGSPYRRLSTAIATGRRAPNDGETNDPALRTHPDRPRRP